jgi:hypothetical protein
MSCKDKVGCATPADWMKAVPTGLAGYTADAVENLTHPFGIGAPKPPSSARR